MYIPIPIQPTHHNIAASSSSTASASPHFIASGPAELSIRTITTFSNMAPSVTELHHEWLYMISRHHQTHSQRRELVFPSHTQLVPAPSFKTRPSASAMLTPHHHALLAIINQQQHHITPLAVPSYSLMTTLPRRYLTNPATVKSTKYLPYHEPNPTQH